MKMISEKEKAQADEPAINCPFCAFSDSDSYFLMQHVELIHPENGQSPYDATSHDGPSRHPPRKERQEASANDLFSEDDEAYIDCPRQCGEAVTLADLPSHMELHQAEVMALDEDILAPLDSSPRLHGERSTLSNIENHFSIALPSALHNRASPSSKDNVGKVSPSSKLTVAHGIDWKQLLWGSPASSSKIKSKGSTVQRIVVKRLGKSDLGPHANEDQMPAWLRKQLERGAKVTVYNRIGPDGQLTRTETVENETKGILPVLAQLCEQDSALEKAYLCHPDVQHVVKQTREGGFCGYRNIQMMVSFIQATKYPGHQHFPGRIPSILRLQDLIEAAWDLGINDGGRIETGGIRGTRKYIGTPEAQALFISLNIPCDAVAFNRDPHWETYERLFKAIEEYFSEGVADSSKKVCCTSLPPLYFQHPGHSLTIVGFERRKSGHCNLLVFDPIFQPAPALSRLLGCTFRTENAERLIKAYRRGAAYMQKYKNFEILKLTMRLPPDAGWDAL